MINRQELELFADLRAASSDAEIVGFEFEGKKYWLKKARSGGANIFHRVAFFCTKIPILAPPSFKNGQEALHHEVGKLNRLHSLGLAVPEVKLLKKEYFILEDAGQSVLDTVRHVSEAEKNLCLEKTITLLAQMHQKGEFHGGAQIKNFTYKDGQVYAIDFEESFKDNIPLENLLLRDLFLFFLSISKHGISANYDELLQVYEKVTDTEKSMRSLCIDFAHKFKKLRWFLKTAFLQKILDKDTKAILRMLDIFLNMEK